MKFPHSIAVDDYGEVTVEPYGSALRVALHFEYVILGGGGVGLELYADESKALRKALKAAEVILAQNVQDIRAMGVQL